MSDKITFSREVNCTVLGKKVYQELTFLKIQTLGSLMAHKKLAGTFCMGHPKCGTQDCQLLVGKSGKVYSEEIND